MFVVFGKLTPSWFVGMPACLSTEQAPPNSQPLSSYYPRSSGSQTDRQSLVFKGDLWYIHRSLLFSSLSFKFHLPRRPEFWYLSHPKRWLLSVWSSFLYHRKIPCDSRHGACGVQLVFACSQRPQVLALSIVKFLNIIALKCFLFSSSCLGQRICLLCHFDLSLLHYDWKWKVYKAFLKIQLLSKSLINFLTYLKIFSYIHTYIHILA